MEQLLLDTALILFVTKLAGIASRKLKMPEVLGALIVGVLLGPAVLHAVAYSDGIRVLSNFGVIFLMFLAGLETNMREFKKAGRSSLVIAALGVALPLALGTASAFLFFSNRVENLFIGIILTATSVSITVETLTELGKLNTRAGVNILGAAVIDDVLGLILISLVLALFGNGGSGGSAALSLLRILLFCTVAILAVVFLPKVLDRYAKKIQPGRTLLTLSIAAALLTAFAAEEAGIASITGAYLFGLLLSSLPQKEYLERNIKAISSGFLSPIFFASVGIEANLSGLNPEALAIALTMFLVAVAGKIFGCGLGARIFGMSRAEALQVGAGMVSRGEVAIITANIGLQNHIISQEVFVPTIIVVILTTIVTPVLLKLSFTHRNQERAERL